MRCFRIPVVLLLTIAFTTPILAGTSTELVPAPEIELEADEAREVEDILADLKRRIVKERPSSARVVYEWFKSAGNEIGVHSDRLTATYAATGREVPKAIGEPLEKFGLAFAITTCLEKQFVSGEPAGWDAAYETAKFLTGKVSGGGAAAVGILKYSLDTFANAAMVQIDSDFYRAYCNWQLQERPDWNFYFDLYRQPGGARKVEAALDRFWLLSAEVAGLRGYGALIHKYKDDLDNAKAAYRQKFSKEYLYPAMKNLWEDHQIDAEAALLLEAAKIRAVGKTQKKVRIDLPKIIDLGTANGAKDLEATLTHSGKYLVARTRVSGSGARFEFPAGKLVHPETRKPVHKVSITVAPVNGARQADRHHGAITLPLVDKHPRIRKAVSDHLISFHVDKPFYVHMAYPVTVKIEGGGSKVTGIRARITPGKSSRYRSGTLSGGRHTKKGNGVFEFESMPTGKCTFTYGNRRATKMITGNEVITLAAPVAASKFTGKVPIPEKPNLAPVNAQGIQALQQLKRFEKFEDDIDIAIGAFKVKMEALKQDYLERFDVAFEKYREQDRLCRQLKGQDAKQRQALKDQLRENRNSLQAAKKAALEDFKEIRNRYSDAEKKVRKEISDGDHEIQTEYSRARKEMYAEYKTVSELEKQIQKAVREVSSELHHNGSVYKTAAEAEVAIAGLEKEVAGLDGLVQQIEASVDAANEARRRFEVQLDAQEKRRFAREQPAAKLPSILADVEQMKLLMDALKKNAVAEKIKQAAVTVKKRHEQRKKNAVQFATLLKEVKKLSGKLPDVEPSEFEKIYGHVSTGFNGILDDPKAKAKEVAKLHARIGKFLDRNDAVVGDMRHDDKTEEVAYARIESLFRQISDMVTSGMVYAGPEYYKAWEPAQAKLMIAAKVRAGVGKRLVELENNLLQAESDLDGYRAKAAEAATETDTLLAQVMGMKIDDSANVAMALDTLDKVWQKTEQMPVCRRESYHEKIFAAAEDLVSGGKLVSYARAAKRPLVVFESYLEGGDVNREVKIGKPLFRCKSGQEPYTALTLKARIEGLPAGKTALISVGDDWYRHTCHREKKTGLHYVTVTLMGDSIPKISILGAGKIQTPIEYPFLRQVALL